MKIRFILSASILCLLFAQLSCNVAGAIAAKTVGERVPAVYVPVPTDPILVIAETFRSSSAMAVDTDQLARFVTDELSRHKIAPTIDPVKVMDLRSSNPGAFRKMTISEIGRKFGAKQVLYINVTDSGIDTAGVAVVMRGQASAKVKIVDVDTSDSRWPEDAAEGYPVNASTTYQKVEQGVTESSVRRDLQETFAMQIAQLFRTYQRG